MQVTEAAMVESAVMVRATRPGVVARRAILLELRRRRGVPASAAELAKTTGIARSSTRLHLATLQEAGMVAASDGRPIRYTLTAAGRIATD